MKPARNAFPIYVTTAMPETTRQRLLQRAATLVGGPAQLAERLNVTPQTMELWMRGLARMPDGKLLELAVILDELSDDST